MGSILPTIARCKLAEITDNAARFKQEPEVINLILVRRRNQIHQKGTRIEEYLPEEIREARNNINNNNTNNNGVVDKQAGKLTEDDK